MFLSQALFTWVPAKFFFVESPVNWLINVYSRYQKNPAVLVVLQCENAKRTASGLPFFLEQLPGQRPSCYPLTLP